MKDYVCGPLGNQHERTQFDCGVSVLNDYLAKYAKQDVKRKASAVFVLVERSEPKRVIGFYTLCATSVTLSELPEEVTRKLPRFMASIRRRSRTRFAKCGSGNAIWQSMRFGQWVWFSVSKQRSSDERQRSNYSGG